MLREIEKYFSRCTNDEKGYGYQFYHWASHNHPVSQLWPVERASGSWKDIACLGVRPLYSNSDYYVEFLEFFLRNSNTSNILQDNLFIILSST